jgi:uncharacterized protein YeaO (DUF488 family)
VTKDQTTLDHWLKKLAPSDELQMWFRKNPQSWPTFCKLYFKDLNQPDAVAALCELYSLASRPERLITTLSFSRNCWKECESHPLEPGRCVRRASAKQTALTYNRYTS